MTVRASRPLPLRFHTWALDAALVSQMAPWPGRPATVATSRFLRRGPGRSPGDWDEPQWLAVVPEEASGAGGPRPSGPPAAGGEGRAPASPCLPGDVVDVPAGGRRSAGPREWGTGAGPVSVRVPLLRTRGVRWQSPSSQRTYGFVAIRVFIPRPASPQTSVVVVCGPGPELAASLSSFPASWPRGCGQHLCVSQEPVADRPALLRPGTSGPL